MMQGWRTTRALARALLQEKWNQSIRFSALKMGIWIKLMQIALVVWVVLEFQEAQVFQFSTVVWVLIFLTVLLSYLDVFGKQEDLLYSNPFLPFIHISPCPPASVLTAAVIADIPHQAFTAALPAIVLGRLLPSDMYVTGGLSLWAIGVLTAVLAQLAGLLMLVGLVRVAPSILGITRILVPGVFISLIAYIVYILITGFPISALQNMLPEMQDDLRLISLIALAPGVLMLLALLVVPSVIGQVYRQGWEVVYKRYASGGSSIRKSKWPALAGGPIGAIQAKEWLQAGRNRFTLLRAAFFVAGLIAAYLLGPVLAKQPEFWAAYLVIAAAYLVVLFSLGELLAAMFIGEGPNLAFYVIAGTSPKQLLLGKMLASIPTGLAGLISTWLFAYFAGLPWTEQFRLAVIGALLGFGMIFVMIGSAAAGISTKHMEKVADSKLMSQASEQMPSGIGAWTGIGLSLLYGAAGAWAGAGGLSATGTVLLVVVLLVLTILCYAAGYARLKRLMLQGK